MERMSPVRMVLLSLTPQAVTSARCCPLCVSMYVLECLVKSAASGFQSVFMFVIMGVYHMLVSLIRMACRCSVGKLWQQCCLLLCWTRHCVSCSVLPCKMGIDVFHG